VLFSIQYTIQYKTYNAPYVTKMLFVGAVCFVYSYHGQKKWKHMVIILQDLLLKYLLNLVFLYIIYICRDQLGAMVHCICGMWMTNK